MRSEWRVGFAGVVVLGLAGVLLTAVAREEDLAFTLGVNPAKVAAVVKPGQQACQSPIGVPETAHTVQLEVGTYGRPGPPLAVTAVSDRQKLGAGSVGAGYADNSTVTAFLGSVPAGRRITLCVRNYGRRQVALYGGGAQADRTSAAFVDDRKLDTDLTLVFKRAHPRSMLSALPDMFQRAALWRPGWAGTWVFWLLLGLVAVGAPLLLGWALAASERVPGGSYDSRP
jgi:hypothetical protein